MADLATRVDEPELMDSMPLDASVTRRTLAFLGMTARRFGGAAAVLNHLSRWSAAWPRGREISILDVGTGGADIPLAIARWSRRAELKVRIVALDLVPGIADIACENTRGFPEIEVRCGDVFDLGAGGATFDYVTASLFLHHVPTPRLVDIVRLFDSMARRGVVVSDLARSRASLIAVGALSWIAGNYVVRHDGPLSVRRSFTAAELDAIARAAGLDYLRAVAAPWFRVTLAGEKR